MARIRSVKPEFWTDEKLSLLDPLTRLVFLGLICMADDAGRLVDNVKLLDGLIFPNTDDSCRQSLDILARTARLLRYRSSSGQELIQIANWEKHQRVDNPSKYNLPGPETAVLTQPAVPSADASGAIRLSDAYSRDSSETLDKPSPLDHRSSTTDHRSTIIDHPVSVDDAAITLTVAANTGLAEHVKVRKRQPIARIISTSGNAHDAAESILQAGIPIAFAESTIGQLARTHTAEGEVRSLRYFVAATVRAWKEDQATKASNGAPSPSPRSPKARAPSAKSSPYADRLKT